MTAASLKNYLPLFKFRICSLITFTAIVGLISSSNAGVSVSASTLLYLALVTMMASAGASAFNHYFDRDIDLIMKRTENRPLPAGHVAGSGRILIAATGLFIASILLSLKVLNPMVALHLFLGGFVYAIVYTVWLKRRSWINIVIGGLAGSFAVLAGGASASPEFCLLPVFLAVVMFFWTPSHFWSFAVLHREEYGRAGIPMLPNIIGDFKTARYVLLNTLLLVLSSLLPVWFGFLGGVYAASAVIFGAFFIYRNIEFIRDQSKEIARKNFRASMIYLSGVFLSVILDISLR